MGDSLVVEKLAYRSKSKAGVVVHEAGLRFQVERLAWDADSHDLLGTARVFPAAPTDAALADATGAQIGRFALAPAARGTGLGRELYQAAVDLGERMHPGQPLYQEAQAGLVDYYAGFGFTPVGELFDDEGVPHQPMLRPAS